MTEMMTAEEYGAQTAAELGYDPADPEVQRRISQGVQAARARMPNADDATIIAAVGPTLKQNLVAQQTSGRLPPPPVQSPVATRMAEVQAQFSPDAEAAARQQGRWARVGAEAGRALGSGMALAAAPGQRAALDRTFQSQMDASRQPFADWQAKKQAALGEVESLIKQGKANRDEVEAQLDRLGLEQALKERETAESLARAENDPQSLHSESLRGLALQYNPEFAKQLGANFNRLTAAQLKQQLPALERIWLKELEKEKMKYEADEKRLERESRERVSRDANASRERAAATVAAARRDATAASQGARAATEKSGILKLENDAQTSIAGADRGLAILQQMRDTINTGKATESGVGEVVSNAQQFIGLDTDRRRADEALRGAADSLIGALGGIDPRLKGAPSNSDIQGIKDTINNPRTTNEEKLRAVARLESMLNDAKKDASTFLSRNQAPVTAESFNAQWSKLKSGESLVGPDGKTYTKR